MNVIHGKSIDLRPQELFLNLGADKYFTARITNGDFPDTQVGFRAKIDHANEQQVKTLLELDEKIPCLKTEAKITGEDSRCMSFSPSHYDGNVSVTIMGPPPDSLSSEATLELIQIHVLLTDLLKVLRPLSFQA